LVPQDARTENGQTIRPFSLAAAVNGSQTVKEFKGMRVGRGEWQIHAATSPETSESSSVTSTSLLKTLGEINWPGGVGKSTKLDSSSKKSTHVGNDGTVTTKSTSTSVSAGVHVSPKAAFQLLDALEGD
jgi:hypothetical protein